MNYEPVLVYDDSDDEFDLYTCSTDWIFCSSVSYDLNDYADTCMDCYNTLTF